MKKLVLLLMIAIFASFCFAISKEKYDITPDAIDGQLQLENQLSEQIFIKNKAGSTLNLKFELTGNITTIAIIDNFKATINSDSNITINLNAYGEEILAVEKNVTMQYPQIYSGEIKITGDASETIPVSLKLYDKSKKETGSLMVEIKPLSDTVIIGKKLRYVIDLKNVFAERDFNVSLSHKLITLKGTINKSAREISFSDDQVNSSMLLLVENLTINRTFSLTKDFLIKKDFQPSEYILLLEINYLDLTSKSAVLIDFQLPFLKRKLFNFLPVWVAMLIIGLGISGFITYKIIKHQIDKKKRFKVKIDFKELPKDGERSIFVGKIAETNKKAYFDMDVLCVHSIVAGSTGGGKSIAAQDIIEEVLIKGAAVVCFDPTAQWSGMLRKCIDKKMLSFYPSMDMKPKDARAFPGNIRAIKNGREIVDVYKYWKPGEIQVFTTATLDPKDYDLFVANVIRQIFHSNLQEFRGLRYMLAFDEIHRILPKFGGSGQGFTQIERGCREFRKWGIGILLISQVLSDFVGQIKANINTNIQMKTRDEGDLGRIKQNYGEEYIQALIKAPVGSGMVQNSAWNRGTPYYITFRPIMHSVVRLSDEELDKYNKYNDIVDDLEFQFEQLEAESQDVFDLKLELKLSKDKIKSGNFNMVQIYLDGLTPRVEKLWNKIGKKPKKLERKLVDLDDMAKELELAKASHDKAVAEDEKKAAAEAASKKEEKKEEVKMDPEQVKANMDSVKQLTGKMNDLIPHKDWMTINDLKMEVKAIPLPEKEGKQRDKLLTDVDKAIEEFKNPPKKDDEKKDGKAAVKKEEVKKA